LLARAVDLREMFSRPFLKILFFTGIIFGEIDFCFSQQNIDSLKTVLQKCEDDTNKVNVLNRLAWNLRSIDPKEAMSYGEKAKSLALQLGFEKGIGNAYNNIGVLHYRRGEYVEAVKSHLQALTIREKTGDKEGMALSYINLGNVYNDQENKTLALEEYHKAENILFETGDEKRLLLIYINISVIEVSENKLADALNYCLKAKEGALKQNDKTVEAEAWNNIGVVKEYQGLYDESLQAYSQAYSISSSIDDKTSMVDNMTNIGNINRFQKKYDDALQWHFKTEKLAREIGYLEGLDLLYQALSKDYEEMGKFELALQYQIHFKALNDSLFNDENNSKINELMSRWEADRHEKELLQLQENLIERELSDKHSTQRTWMIDGGLFFLLVFASYFFYTNGKIKRNKLLIETQQAIIERKGKN
jgi:tetratricopeptide (TPR) repeat protein